MLVVTDDLVEMLDRFGRRETIPLRYHRAGRLPQRGETWVMDRSMGYWTLLMPLDGVVTPTSKFATTITPTAGVTETIKHRLGRDVLVQVFDDVTGASFDPVVIPLNPESPPVEDNIRLGLHVHGDGSHTHYAVVPQVYDTASGELLRAQVHQNPRVRRFAREEFDEDDWVELVFREQPPGLVRVVLIG